MMNERIKDLFETACFETEYDDTQNLPEMIERFAELLIKDERSRCVDILERLHERAGETHNYYLYAANMIKGGDGAALL